MNIIVQKVMNGKDSSPSSSPVPSSVKMCRYGLNCIRAGCRFRHVGKDAGKIKSNNFNKLVFGFSARWPAALVSRKILSEYILERRKKSDYFFSLS